MKKLNIFKKKTAKNALIAIENLSPEQMVMINGGTTGEPMNETAMKAIGAIR